MLSPLCLVFLVRLGGYIENLWIFYFYKIIGKLTAFLKTSEVQLTYSTSDQFHYHRVMLSTCGQCSTVLLDRVISFCPPPPPSSERDHSPPLLPPVGWGHIVNILVKVVTLKITLKIDGAPLVSRSHMHPSHSQTSHLLTSSLSLGVPVPHATQCTWGV